MARLTDFSAKPQSDSLTGASPVVSDFDRFIHEGLAFKAQVSNAALADNGLLYIQFKCPTGVKAQLNKIYAQSNGLCVFTLVEAPTFTTGDSAVTAFNCDRNSAKVTTLTTLFSNPTSISGGTGIITGYAGATGAITAETQEKIILKENTTYILQIQNKSGGAAYVSIGMNWIEL